MIKPTGGVGRLTPHTLTVRRYIMRFASIVLLVSVAFSTGLFAQDRSTKRAEHKAAFQELRADLRSWFERDVYPTAKMWHEQYDASLAPEDLRTLQGLRAEAKRLKEAVTSDIRNLRGTFERGDRSELREKIGEIRDNHRESVEQLLERLKPIAKRSRTKLREMFDANEDKIESWRDQARQIVGDWRDEHDDLNFRGMFSRGGHNLPLIGGDGRKAAIRFILWDGSMPPASESKTSAPRRMPMNISPAPSGNNATVDISNIPDGQHTLQVFDMNGTMVRSTTVTALSGQVHHNIDLSGLAAGAYMVSINTPAGRSTSNVVVSK
jgi:hypothetical protein